MKPIVIIFITVTPVIVLLQVLALLFNLYRYPLIAAGLCFFTSAVLLLGLFAAHAERIIPYHHQPPRWPSAFIVAVVVGGLTVFMTAQVSPQATATVGTMEVIAACLLGTSAGRIIGTQLTSVSL